MVKRKSEPGIEVPSYKDIFTVYALRYFLHPHERASCSHTTIARISPGFSHHQHHSLLLHAGIRMKSLNVVILCIGNGTNSTHILAVLNTCEKETELLKYCMPTMPAGSVIYTPV